MSKNFTVIKGGGLDSQKPRGKVLPLQTDEQAEALRERLIASGQIVESNTIYREGERPPMPREMINRLQERLKKLGIYRPK